MFSLTAEILSSRSTCAYTVKPKNSLGEASGMAPCLEMSLETHAHTQTAIFLSSFVYSSAQPDTKSFHSNSIVLSGLGFKS